MRSYLLRALLNGLAAALMTCAAECLSQEKAADPDRAPQPLNIPSAKAIPKPLITAPVLQTTPNLQVQQITLNGFRTIIAKSPELKVEITDTNGKNITLKQAKLVNGKLETTEFKADDLAALKIKSAEAAALYEKYALPQPVGGPFQVQVEIRTQVPQPPIPIDDSQANPGLRSIRVELTDRKIEIFDSVDESIVVKISKTQNGKPQVDEFTADNLKQFKNLHPEAYRLYKKYTGLKADVNE